MTPVYVVGIVVVVGALIAFGATILFARFYRQVEQGKALIVNKMRAEPEVAFTGAIVLPDHQPRRGDGHLGQDDRHRPPRQGRPDLQRQHPRRHQGHVLRPREQDAARTCSRSRRRSAACARRDPKTLEELFTAKFSEALKTVGKQFDFERALHEARRVQGQDHRGHRQGPERLHPRRRRDRLPRADAARGARSGQHHGRRTASGRSPR